MRRALLIATCGALVLSGATALAKPSSITRLKQATAQYHDLAAAKADGYGLFTDAQGIACIDLPGEGAMGVHYVKGSLVGDGAVDAEAPEALVYQPTPEGLKLVAVEYVVFQADWDAAHDRPPVLHGRQFTLVGAGNRYGLPPFYELHAWVWKNNPSGTFADWNPRVSC